jgi:two-component system sensor histidine kinase RegB
MRSHDQVPEARASVVLGPWVRGVVEQWSQRHDDLPVPVRVGVSAESCRAELQSDSLRRAMHSLLDNALLAMERTPGASSADPISVAVERGDDGRVGITVLDRGVGISDASLARVGEPFFTTREPGQGMGLGLFLVHATVEQHGGVLAISSGDGITRVRMSLPVTGD